MELMQKLEGLFGELQVSHVCGSTKYGLGCCQNGGERVPYTPFQEIWILCCREERAIDGFKQVSDVVWAYQI